MACFSLHTTATEDTTKRKTRSNLIMVVLIAVIMVAGMIGAYFLMGDQSGFQLGTLFSGADLTDETGEYTCTITIRCDTVLSNKGKLNEAKAPYIPDDGIILAQVTAAFTPGETVFGVLQRVCEKGDIQLETAARCRRGRTSPWPSATAPK